MLKLLIVVFFTLTVVSSQTWVSRGSLDNYVEYYMKLMQGMFGEIEKREWCSLKLNDITQVIDDTFYDFRVAGTVNYVNGFVVSIQKIDVESISESVSTRTIDGVAVPHGTVSGRVNFRDMMIGHDVVANLTIPFNPNFRSTGTFLHTLVQIKLDLTQNLITKEFSGEFTVLSVNAGSGVRMIYMPANNITEAIGRRFSASTFSTAAIWARDIFIPIMIELASNEYGFPDVCFNNCT